MPLSKHKLTPCLWFDTQAEQAAEFYCSVFENSKITRSAAIPDAGQEIHKKPAGSVMVVAFELDGQPFTALNGGPIFKFDEAVSFQVIVRDPGRDRLLLEHADRRRRPGRPLRLAEGQVRPVLAGGAERHPAHDERSGRQQIARAS